MMKKSNKKGFTLVELIVVIAIMAILAAVLVPTVTSKIKDANDSAAKSDCSGMMSTVQSALTSYLSDPKDATKVSAQLGNAFTAAALPASGAMPTDKGTYVYGTETQGFVIFTVNGSIKYYGSVDKDGKTAGPSTTEITALPNA